MIEIGAGVVLIAVLILLYVWYTNGLTSYKPGTKSYQYHSGMKIEYSGNASFYNEEQSGKGIKVEDNGVEGDVIKAPIISEEDGQPKLTLTADMVLYNPRETLAPSKVFTFTEVISNERKATLFKDKKEAENFAGFLYDGEDVYIFFDYTKVVVGLKEYELPPLSYVRAVYNQQVEIFDSSTGKCEVLNVSGVTMTAYCDSGYEINLASDLLYSGEDIIILNIPIEGTTPLEMEKHK